MHKDFHYYATYCAAILAGYNHEDSVMISWSAQFVDECTLTLLNDIGGPRNAATTQLKTELANISVNPISLQNMTRIWSSFHFLPYDLYAECPGRPRQYANKYRLICKPNGALIKDTVELAKRTGTLQAVGIAMHILADSWAHAYFAGTPSLVMNNTTGHFYELIESEDGQSERRIRFRHSPGAVDDTDKSIYNSSMYRSDESSVMNLGHGRAGNLPDYSFARYRYLPAWGGYEETVKDNPSDYYNAFCQMVYAMKYLRGVNDSFEPGCCDEAAVEPLRDEIMAILTKRQLYSADDWQELGKKLSGMTLGGFSVKGRKDQYKNAPKPDRDSTFLGGFFLAAMAQKSMVTNKIFSSGSLIAGFSVDYDEAGFKGIKDYRRLVELWKEGMRK